MSDSQASLSYLTFLLHVQFVAIKTCTTRPGSHQPQPHPQISHRIGSAPVRSFLYQATVWLFTPIYIPFPIPSSCRGNARINPLLFALPLSYWSIYRRCLLYCLLRDYSGPLPYSLACSPFSIPDPRIHASICLLAPL